MTGGMTMDKSEIDRMAEKFGGRFKLTVLLQKRVRELVKGAPRLVECDHKNLIDVAVPHMGIVTSIDEVYEWLGRENYQFVYDRRFSRENCMKARLARGGTPARMTADAATDPAARPSSAPASTRAD